MQWPSFDIIGTLFQTDRRVAQLEERQRWAIKQIDATDSRITTLEKRFDRATTTIGLILLAFLVLVNLPPNISEPIIRTIVDLLPGYQGG